MTSQEYIIKELNSLVEKFPKLVFKYKFDNTDSTHIIAVEPLNEFNGNKEYLNAESDFVYYFENTFLPETVLFVSQDSLTKIIEPDMIFKRESIGIFIKEKVHAPNYIYDYNLEKIEVGFNNEFALAA